MTNLLGAQFPALYSWAEQALNPVAHWFNPAAHMQTLPTKNWLFVHPGDLVVVQAAYLGLVFIGVIMYMLSPKKKAAPAKSAAGPKKPQTWGDVAASFHDEPIKYIQVVYNTVQTALSAYMAIEAVRIQFDEDYALFGNTRTDAASTKLLHLFFCTKVLDMLDTVFMIVRGKWQQFSFLHTYHHSSIHIIYWMLTAVSGQQGSWSADINHTIFLNGTIHAALYFYYLCTSLGIKCAWAKLLTSAQLVQFFLMLTYGTTLLIIDTPFPRRVTVMYLLYITTMVVLFGLFFMKRYKAPAGSKKKGAASKPKKE